MAQQLAVTDLPGPEALQEALKRDRLQVVELYSEWAGPTQAIKPTWRKLMVEHGGQLPFDISTAALDTRCREAEALERHVSAATCEPHFLLFRGGKEVAHVVGLDLPTLLKAIQKHSAEGTAVQRQESEM